MLHPSPKRALFLGLGTGATFSAAAHHPGLQGTRVELIPEVIPLLHYFDQAAVNLTDDTRLHIVVADARRFVNVSGDGYDVIIADLFHPARDGAGSLYTAEHFRAVRSLLEENGLFCQWLPLYQFDLDTLRIIVRSFLHVFPDGAAYPAHFSLKTPIPGLISAAPADGYDPEWFARRVSAPSLARRLEQLRLDSVYALVGGFLAGSRELAAFAHEAPFNTDDRPEVVFRAPRFAYAGQEPAHVRLLALVDGFAPRTDEVLKAGTGPDEHDLHARLAAYWAARDQFLRLGVGVSQTGDVKQMPNRVGDPLLTLVRMSPDFQAAYDPLVAMARALHSVDAPATRDLLLALEEANPERNEAKALLMTLFVE